MFELLKLGNQSTVFVNPAGISGSDAWRDTYREAGELFPRSKLKKATPQEVVDGVDDFQGKFSTPSNRQVATVKVPRSVKGQATRIALASGVKPAGEELRDAVTAHVEGLIRTAAVTGGIAKGKDVKLDPNEAVLSADWLALNYE